MPLFRLRAAPVVVAVIGGLAACGTLLDISDDPSGSAGSDGGRNGDADIAVDGGIDANANANPDGASDARVDAARGKLVFVTESVHTGNLNGVAGADDICNAEAKGSGIAGTFVAFLETDTVKAAERLRDGGAGWSRADRIVAFDTAPPSVPNVALDRTADAAVVDAGDHVWTGQNTFGPNSKCGAWMSSSASEHAGYGDPKVLGDGWHVNGTGVDDCSQPLHLYCFEQ